MEIPRLCRGGSRSLTFPGVPRSGSVVSSHSHERNRTDGRVRDAKPHDLGLQIYRAHPRSRKSLGEIIRKLSVTESQDSAHLLGTSSRRNSRVVSANSPQVP